LAISPSSGGGEQPRIKVIVASSRPAVAATWLSRLANEPRLELAAATVSSPRDIRAAIDDLRPRVVLLDAASLVCLDADVSRVLRAASVRVLLISHTAGPHLVDLVLSHRVHGYLIEVDAKELCVKAILGVCRGELWMPRAALTEALYRSLDGRAAETAPADKPTDSARRAPLTERERQVTACVRKGYSNTQIARELGITKDTVKKHSRHVFGKLAVQRRADIAAVDPALALESD
jgi:DNA-binding NarL/FixJ family response regulator